MDKYVSENGFSSHGSTSETELVQPFEKTPGCFLPSILDVHSGLATRLVPCPFFSFGY